jgi:hypothetical protein
MSQALVGRTESSGSTHPAMPRPARPGRGAQRRPGARALRRLLLGLALVCAAAPAASAQRAQTVQSAQPVLCGAKSHHLRLVTAEAPINGKTAKALVVALTPEDKTDKKVFGLYWMNDQSPAPTHRDDTRGTLGSALVSYNKGLAGVGEVVQSFFNEVRCTTVDPQSIDSQLVSVQNLMGTLSGAPDDLHGVARELESQGVRFDDEQVKDASAGNQILFNGLSNEVGFAKAIRQYVDSVSGFNGGRIDDPGAQNLSQEDKIARLSGENTRLEREVAGLRAEQNSLFGSAPSWLVAVLSLTSATIGAALGFVAWGYHNDRRGASPTDAPLAVTPQPGQGGETTGGQASYAHGNLAGIIAAASIRRRDIEQRYRPGGQWSDARNRSGKGQGDVAGKIINQLKNNLLLIENNTARARAAIEQGLGEANSAVSQSQQQTNEWRNAFVELQTQVEGLQKDPSERGGGATVPVTPPTSTGSAEMSPVVQQMAGTVGQLSTDIKALKSSVDEYNNRLTKYFEASKGLQDIWWNWYGQAYAGERTDAFVKEVREAIDLYRFLKKRCSNDGASIDRTMKNMESVVGDLDVIRKVYLAKSLGETALLNQITEKLKNKLTDDAAAAESLKNKKEEARRKLAKYQPDLTFMETVDAVVADYEALTNEVKQVLPDKGGSVRGMVASLATAYRNLKPVADQAQQLEIERDELRLSLNTAREQVAASKELVEEVALHLNFRTDRLKENERAVTEMLDRLKKERESSAYAQLRMGLSSALLALEKATVAGGPDEQTDVVEALYLDKVKRGIQTLLGEMEQYEGEQLWDMGLSEGFGQKWLHYLIRADLLLRTYYSDRWEFGFLRKAVSLASSAMLAALYEFQVVVVEVGLFEELPEGMGTDPVSSGIRNLPAVRDKVSSKIDDNPTNEVVVDVTSFPYFVKRVQQNPGRASRANPSAWKQG